MVAIRKKGARIRGRILPHREGLWNPSAVRHRTRPSLKIDVSCLSGKAIGEFMIGSPWTLDSDEKTSPVPSRGFAVGMLCIVVAAS